jgi:hypothetical protein
MSGTVTRRVTLDEATQRTNAFMAGFDLVLGTGTLLAPGATLRVLGHDEPASAEAEQLFRRCAPIWLTFAAAHLVAARRDRPEDWWALAWLRATEWFTDVLWAQSSPSIGARGRLGLRLAGAANMAMSLAFARRARRR